jgi:hypothetical protein
MNDPIDSTPAPKSGSNKKWWWIAGCGGCGCLAFFASALVFLLPAMVHDSWVEPVTTVVPGASLTADDRDWLTRNVGLEPDEEIVWFYSADGADIEWDGQFVTPRRVVSYEELEDGAIGAYGCAYDEIDSLQIEWSDEAWSDTFVTVTVDGGEDSFYLILSTKDDLDHVFVEYIQERIR